MMNFLSPIFTYAARFLMVGICFCAFYKFDKRDVKKIFILSTLEAFVFYGIALSIKNLDSSTTGVMTKIDIVLTMVFASLTLGEKIKTNVIVATILCFVGLFVINKQIDLSNVPYVLLMVLVAIFSAMANIITKQIQYTNSMAITVWTSLIMGIELMIVSMLTENQFVLRPLNLTAIMVFLYLSLVSTFLCYFIFYYTMRKFLTTITMPLRFLQIVFTIISGRIILGEALTTSKILGTSIIVLGLFVSQMNGDNKKIKN